VQLQGNGPPAGMVGCGDGHDARLAAVRRAGRPHADPADFRSDPEWLRGFPEKNWRDAKRRKFPRAEAGDGTQRGVGRNLRSEVGWSDSSSEVRNAHRLDAARHSGDQVFQRQGDVSEDLQCTGRHERPATFARHGELHCPGPSEWPRSRRGVVPAVEYQRAVRRVAGEWQCVRILGRTDSSATNRNRRIANGCLVTWGPGVS
jgi:hypothetical protein